MGHRTSWFAAALAPAAVVCIVATADPARADTHRDEKLGYSINVPRGFKAMPIDSEEKWLVAHFQSDRTWEGTDETRQFTVQHTPFVDVVVMPLALLDRKGGTVRTGKTGEGDTVVTVDRSSPYKDFKDYLDRNYRGGGGFFFSKEEERTEGGLRVVEYELTFEKLVDSPKKIWAMAWHTSDAIYGIAAESLVQHEKKLRPDLMACLKSFKAFPRTGALEGAAQTGSGVSVEDLTSKDSKTDREKKRKEKEAREITRVREQAGDGWRVVERPRFTAISHTDDKFTRSVLDHAEAFRDWLDANLAYMGDGYAGKVVIRILASSAEHDAYMKTEKWSSDKIQIATFKDNANDTDWAWEHLNREIFRIWLRDKDRDLQWGLPRWIDSGLDNVVEAARLKGGKIEFRFDQAEADRIRELRRADKLLPARSFFTMTSEELYREESNYSQAPYFVRCLLTGAASKSGKLAGVFADYVRNLRALLEEEEKASKAGPPDDGTEKEDEPDSEEEEDAAFKKKQSEWAQSEKESLAKLFERTFKSWTDKDWDALTAAYWRDVK